MSVFEDMSGVWSGEYRYRGLNLSARFSLLILEKNGKLRGTALEQVILDPDAEPDEYEATIRGDRCGQHVIFTKRYTGHNALLQPPLIYAGAADSGFQCVTGRWVFADDAYLDGTFTLTRVLTGAAATLMRADAE